MSESVTFSGAWDANPVADLVGRSFNARNLVGLADGSYVITAARVTEDSGIAITLDGVADEVTMWIDWSSLKDAKP